MVGGFTIFLVVVDKCRGLLFVSLDKLLTMMLFLFQATSAGDSGNISSAKNQAGISIACTVGAWFTAVIGVAIIIGVAVGVVNAQINAINNGFNN